MNIDDMATFEILEELLTRIRESNGLAFCDPLRVAELVKELTKGD